MNNNEKPKPYFRLAQVQDLQMRGTTYCHLQILYGLDQMLSACEMCLADDSIDCNDVFSDDCESDDDCSDGEICEDGDCISDGDDNACDDCMEYCVAYVMENYGFSEQDAYGWCSDTSDESYGCADTCDNSGSDDDGPTECVYDCPDATSLMEEDMSSDEECTIISSWSSEECINDCESDESYMVNMYISACTEC